MDYNKLIKELRAHDVESNPKYHYTHLERELMCVCHKAAAAIETLLAEREEALTNA